MEELLIRFSKKYAPNMPSGYHAYTVELMKHMLALAAKKKELEL
jgi:hypothetical protein